MNKPKPPLRRWSLFTIQSCLLLTALVAVVVAWWIDHTRLKNEIAAADEKATRERYAADERFARLRADYRDLKMNADILAAEFALLRFLHEGKNVDQGTVDAIDNLEGNQPIRHSLLSIERKRYEVFLLHGQVHTPMGSDRTVALLIRDGVLVDSFLHETDATKTRHLAKLDDINDDGQIELVMSISENSAPAAVPRSEIYEIAATGFVKQK